MLKGIKTRAFLIGTLAVSFLISGCGVKKDSDDKVMLTNMKNITRISSDGQKKLSDISHIRRTRWQYDSGKNLLIGSNNYSCSNVSVYDMETGVKTDIGFPDNIEYEGQTLSGINAWYEDGKVKIYADNSADGKLFVFTFDCKTKEPEDIASYDIKSSAFFVRDTGNLIVYVKNVMEKTEDGKYKPGPAELTVLDKRTGEIKTVDSGIGKLGKGFDLIVLNADKSKVLYAKTKDDAPVLCEYDIPSGETCEVYKCSKGDYITGFTYAIGSNKIYLRYGKRVESFFITLCQPNHTRVITTDGRNYELHSSLVDGYDMSTPGIVIY